MKTAFLLLLMCTCATLDAQKTHVRLASQPHTALRERFDNLVCAIAFIQTERGSGTGFFVNAQGDLVTAAHVVSTKMFKALPTNQIDFDVIPDSQIFVTANGQKKVQVNVAATDIDKTESATDLTYIHTSIHPKCFIPLSNSKDASTGDHLISIGFPGIDMGNPILYEGFLSGRFPHPPNVAVAVINGNAIAATYEVLKVQMPITPGASGSPIIDDSGRAIGVVSESPIIWTEDLQKITSVAGTGSGIALSGFDVVKTLGQLALVVREFESPGSGYAVPLSGLNPTRVATQTASIDAR